MKIQRVVLERQLSAAHASLAASIAAVEAALAAAGMLEDEGDEPEVGCRHPAESRKNLSTSGWDRWQCTLCGHVH